MRRTRLIVFLLIAGTLLALYLTLNGLGLLGPPPLAEVKGVPRGHQEIAFIHTATSVESWERFVKAVRHVQSVRPELQLEALEGTQDQVAAVPEIALWVRG